MVRRVMLLTGAPGVGKTTVVAKVAEALKAEGVSVGGMISRETRDGCARMGFEVIDLTSDKHGWLAHVDQKTGPQVGKYRVNLADLDRIGAKAIIEATKKFDVIAIDEIGPMELYSAKFKQAVEEAFDSRKLVLAVVHAKATNQLITAAKRRADAETFVVTPKNRDALPGQLVERILKGS